MMEKKSEKNAKDSTATARATFPALDYWIRTYCTPGILDATATEYARTSEAAALADLKHLLRFGAVTDFVELSATYCRVAGACDKPDTT